jgi:hypothetical protein
MIQQTYLLKHSKKNTAKQIYLNFKKRRQTKKNRLKGFETNRLPHGTGT